MSRRPSGRASPGWASAWAELPAAWDGRARAMKRSVSTMVLDRVAENEVLEEAKRYFIDRTWFDENDLVFEEVVQARLCAECQSKLGTEELVRKPVYDKKTGRMTFELRPERFAANPVQKIKEHCSKARDFITPEMPTLEAVFRVLLASGNQPMPLDHVRELLVEWCPSGGCQWLLLPLEVLERVIEHDNYYGIRRHVVPVSA